MKMNNPLRRWGDEGQSEKDLRRDTLKDKRCDVLETEPLIILRMPH
jgi:hypothetical protein